MTSSPLNDGSGGSLVVLRGVSKTYPSSADASPVLNNVNLTVRAGQSLAIMGPSGSGKTTLLNIIGALDRPDSGSVEIGGVDIDSRNDDQLAGIRSRQIGFIFQSHHLLPQCSALENVLVSTIPLRGADSSTPSRAKKLLERVGLTEQMHQRPGQLSGGERQRVALIRALINEPLLVLADEPTGSLDRTRADEMAQLLIDLNKEQGVALIVVTHDPHLAELMDRTLYLRDGNLVESSDPF